MLSDKLRVALDNLLPGEDEDETYLGTPTLRDAAVLIAFTDRPEPGIILTQRPQWLRSHAGQVAFPGGKIDPGDVDAVDAALREAEEEIGLNRRDVTIAGTCDAYR
ncbi:MAG: NUDIX hydrolase, partial [Sphingopyxis sp.]